MEINIYPPLIYEMLEEQFWWGFWVPPAAAWRVSWARWWSALRRTTALTSRPRRPPISGKTQEDLLPLLSNHSAVVLLLLFALGLYHQPIAHHFHGQLLSFEARNGNADLLVTEAWIRNLSNEIWNNSPKFIEFHLFRLCISFFQPKNLVLIQYLINLGSIISRELY